ncbi:MAG: hypothetical protein WD740_00830 [Anaerolineales bacterium]
MRVALVSILIAAGLSACTLPDPASGIPESWHLSLEVSGGLAGIHRQLTLSSLGELVATDHNTATVVALQISAAELIEVANLVSRIQLAATAPAGSLPPCNDCFEYTLGISLGREQIEIVANDISLADSPFAPLVSKLNDLLQKALTGDVD